MKTHWTLLALLGSLSLGSTLSAQDYLPLGDGNYWTYQSTTSSESFTIRASIPHHIGNRVYYSVTGYGAEKRLLRSDESGVVAWNEETEQEELLTSFTADNPYRTKLSGCEQQATPDGKAREYGGPAGYFQSSKAILYQSSSCADTGFGEEIYLANIGLARRTVTTFRGPVTYELVEARVGKFTFAAGPNTQARLSLEGNSVQRRNASEPFLLNARFTISTISAIGVKVTYPTAQQYEMVVRNEAGEVVYRWSDGQVFAESIKTESIDGRKSVNIQAEFSAAASAALPDGFYTVEAWLTTGDGPRFASSATFELFTGGVI
jgi:hypothetical protein